jgi:hypothetical protein
VRELNILAPELPGTPMLTVMVMEIKSLKVLVRLLNEGTYVLRHVPAEEIEDGRFILKETDNYDSVDEE